MFLVLVRLAEVVDQRSRFEFLTWFLADMPLNRPVRDAVGGRSVCNDRSYFPDYFSPMSQQACLRVGFVLFQTIFSWRDSAGRQPLASLVLVLYITSLWRAACRLCLVGRFEFKFVIGGQHHFACTSIGAVGSVELS